jgi:DNA polymerase-1
MISEVLINNGYDDGSAFYSLKEVAEKYLGVSLDKTIRDKFIGDTPITEEMLEYASEDVSYLEPIYRLQRSALEKQKQLRVLELENKVIPIIAEMRINGIRVDINKWNQVSKEAKQKLLALEKELIVEVTEKSMEKFDFTNVIDCMEKLLIPKPKGIKRVELATITDKKMIYNFIKNSFNLASHTQMLNVLVSVYGIKLTDTNEKTINKHTKNNPIINKLIAFRGFEKEVSSFDKGYLSKINPITGRIHTHYHQVGARTGRFSSTDPNMQNVKGKNDEGESKYRTCFVADEGKVLISADYSQQELRILADITRDRRMLETFEKQLDPHKVTAMGLFHKDYDEITSQERSRGKTLNFAINYGTTEFGLDRNFDIPKTEGKEYIKNYFLFYEDYNKYVKYVSAKIWEYGYASTLLGRKRFFTKKNFYEPSVNPQYYKEKILRSLRNLIVQGTGADMTKTALVNIFYGNPFGDKLKILLQVHDEIVFECDIDIVEKAVEYIREEMLKAEDMFLKVVESKVDVKYSHCWEH